MDTTASFQLPPNTQVQKKRSALLWCMGITLITMLIEIGVGIYTGSLMLFSDGLHMLSHGSSLFISYLAMVIAQRPANKKYPFGYRRAETLAALINGISLAFFIYFIAAESIARLFEPRAIDTTWLLIVAGIGLMVNLWTALILSRAGLEDLNTRSAFLHMLADTFSSVAIILGAILIYYTGWFIIDAVLSLVVAFVIGKWAYGLIRTALLVLMERSPKSIRYFDVEVALKSKFPTIEKIEDLRLWELSSDYYCAILKIETRYKDVRLAKEVQQFLQEEFQVADSTVQIV